MYIKRTAASDIIEGAKHFPVVAILGPRQSGKTTLAREIFPSYTYVSLEDPDLREAAINDPRTFLAFYGASDGIIIDEFQYVPDLLSYIKTAVDTQQKNGFYILTGSQNFLMNQAISQSLAGRVSLHTLLPLSSKELANAKLLPEEIEEVLYRGLYPAIYTKGIPADRLYGQYIKTYIERDVRELTHVGDLALFQTFLIMCAERVGQLINFSELARECHVSDQTIRRWLTILEASYIVYLLHPYEKTLSKRFIKSAKLFFFDPGIVCHLLKLTQTDLITNQKRGQLFEAFVIAELLKGFYNTGNDPRLYFWRDQAQHEVDCIIDYGTHLIALEIKASRTISASFFSGLAYWETITAKKDQKKESYVIYGGKEKRVPGYKNVINWQDVESILSFLRKP